MAETTGTNPVRDYPLTERGDGRAPPDGPLDAISEAVTRLGNSASPSVVAVRIQRPGPIASPAFGGETRVSSAGSGVVLSENGLIVTAAHVIERADEITVAVSDAAPVDAEVVGKDGATDLAVLRIDATDLSTIDFAGSKAAAPGQMVIAVGRPPGFGIALTTGLVSALERSVRSSSGDLVENVIQTSAAIGPGTSGGALIDSRGRLVGLLTSAAEVSSGAISFAIPAETVEWMTGQLVGHGRVARAELGFSGETVAIPGYRRSLLAIEQASGVAVRSQRPQSPSARAGMEMGDVIVGVSGESVSRLGELQRILCRAADEAELEVQVVREDALLDFRVRPASTTDSSRRGE